MKEYLNRALYTLLLLVLLLLLSLLLLLLILLLLLLLSCDLLKHSFNFRSHIPSLYFTASLQKKLFRGDAQRFSQNLCSFG